MRTAGFVTAAIFLQRREYDGSIFWLTAVGIENRGQRNLEMLNASSRAFIEMVEGETGVPVTLIGTGPNNADIIDLR
jgi:adenylosuccinate synthase